MKLTDKEIEDKAYIEAAKGNHPKRPYIAYKRAFEKAAKWARDKACEWVNEIYELPKTGERIIVYDAEFGVQVGFLNSDGHFMTGIGTTLRSVTHWQPLPDKPKSE